jgi:FMN phosphatase YigB (HAD superfamily)
MLTTPQALLLDFGGVLVDAPHDPGWTAVVVDAVERVLAAAGAPPVPPDEILAALDGDDRAADQHWREAAPTQPDHASHWADRVAAGWPPAARAAVAAQAPALSRTLIQARHADRWRLRPGMAELLADAQARGLPMAVVSNTLYGAVHREFLDGQGLADRFVAQFYSDEEGVRKPNPALAQRAVAVLGVEPDGCWFVGDTLTRDVLVARRAGLGSAILMRSQRVEGPPYPEGLVPDAVVDDPVALHRLLAAHSSPAA